MDGQADTFVAALATLFQKGVRYSTVFDLGCADGNFFLVGFSMGLFPGASCVNVDANPIYEQSLKSIKEVMGGEYVIAAVTDHVGEVELNTSAHHYWASLLPDHDPYWTRLHDLRGEKVKVPAVTLDTLAEQFGLKPPFLIKLDLQGSELAALRGGRKVLSQTDVIVCETATDEFSSINAFLDEAGFNLFDLTSLDRFADNTLGWFYPVYLNRRLEFIKQFLPWDRSQNDHVVRLQVDRRKDILAYNAAMLAKVRAQRGNAS
jgi:FkbM family methyltransferase